MEYEFRAAEEKLEREHEEIKEKARAKMEEERRILANVQAALDHEASSNATAAYIPRKLDPLPQENLEDASAANFIPKNMKTGGRKWDVKYDKKMLEDFEKFEEEKLEAKRHMILEDFEKFEKETLEAKRRKHENMFAALVVFKRWERKAREKKERKAQEKERKRHDCKRDDGNNDDRDGEDGGGNNDGDETLRHSGIELDLDNLRLSESPSKEVIKRNQPPPLSSKTSTGHITESTGVLMQKRGKRNDGDVSRKDGDAKKVWKPSGQLLKESAKKTITEEMMSARERNQPPPSSTDLNEEKEEEEKGGCGEKNEEEADGANNGGVQDEGKE